MKNKRKANIPIFVPHYGCKNDCIFCNQKRITKNVLPYDFNFANEKIEKSLDTISDKEIEIAFFGGSFTGISEDIQNKYLAIANEYIKNGQVKGIRISTRPDLIDEKVLERLKKFNVTTIELGAQSMDDKVLYEANRGHTANDVKVASKLILDYKVSLGLQMMTGLLGSSEEKDIFTAKEFIKLKPNMVRIYPTVVILDTVLYEKYKNKKYRPQSLEEAVKLCAKIYELFHNEDISVIRCGLLATDGEISGFVDGPYHPSFGELVKQEFVLNKICNYININETRDLVIKVNERYISTLVGQKRKNALFLQKKYGLDLNYIVDNNIDGITLDGLTINKI